MSDSLDTHADAHTVLVRAKAYLLTHGWRTQCWDVGRPSCIGGAIANVTETKGLVGFDWNRHVEAHDAARAICRAVGAQKGSRPLANWNDAPERTFDDVIAALDAAIYATAPSAETREAIPA